MELAERIRNIAKMKYVVPARAAGKREFSIAVKDLMDQAEAEGISTVQRTPLFCTSIQTRGFREDNGLEVAKVEGPASKKSTTVVVHYRAKDAGVQCDLQHEMETPEERASRLVTKIRGLMKDEIDAHGGAEGFIRWVRSDEDEA